VHASRIATTSAWAVGSLVEVTRLLRDEAQIAFQEWANKTDKVRY